MKIVIKDVGDNVVTSDRADSTAFFLAVTNPELYILRRESTGWIFRSVSNSRFGHSGYHESPRDAIENAISVGATKIFQFDNFVELAQYVVSHTKP